MNPNLLLTPKRSPNKGPLGMLPHRRYQKIRAQAEEIIKARDHQGLSDYRAAHQLGFRSSKEYSQAYELLKDNGRRIVEHGDWSGVEAIVYSKHPGYRSTKKFHDILMEFGDSRAMPGSHETSEQS